MRRAVGAVILVALSYVLIRLALYGDYVNFVKPGNRPWLLAAGGGLLLCGIAGILQAARHSAPHTEQPPIRRAAAVHTHGPLRAESQIVEELVQLDREHNHSRLPGVAWLLLIPVFLVLLVPPPALGAYAASRAGATVPPVTEGTTFAALPPGDPVQLQVHDYAERAVWDHGRTLQGRTVILTGFTTPNPDGGWYLSRMRITCCAADARSYLVEVVPDTAPGTAKAFPANTWLQVTGHYLPSTNADPTKAICRIALTDVRPTDKPAEPYEQ